MGKPIYRPTLSRKHDVGSLFTWAKIATSLQGDNPIL